LVSFYFYLFLNHISIAENEPFMKSASLNSYKITLTMS
jgi:hypothetical protein